MLENGNPNAVTKSTKCCKIKVQKTNEKHSKRVVKKHPQPGRVPGDQNHQETESELLHPPTNPSMVVLIVFFFLHRRKNETTTTTFENKNKKHTCIEFV